MSRHRCQRLVLSRITWGIGRQRMAMSQRMLGTEMQSCVRNKSMQNPLIQGFQIFSRGVHWKVAAMMHAIFHAVDRPPQMYPPRRTERTGKTRK
jgi:hypothetical protein